MQVRAVVATSPPTPSTGADLRAVAGSLAELVEQLGAAPVDEDEERRLAGRRPARDRLWVWSPRTYELDGHPVAYAGIRTAMDHRARVDLTLARRADGRNLSVTFERIPAELLALVSGPLELWLRGAEPSDVAAAQALGFVEQKRLHVLGLAAVEQADRRPPPAGIVIERSTAAHTDAVGRMFSIAHGDADDGWDEEGLAVRRDSDWFRFADVLLAWSVRTETPPDAPRELVGIHWMKRRSATVGEVHNLVVHPEHQGRGIGAALLDAGLAHLFATGCAEVLLWVDADNTPALELYRSRGFAPRWDDVAVQRDGR